MFVRFHPRALSSALLSSTIVALAAHAVLERLTGWRFAGRAFADHPHDAIGPVATIAVALAIAIVATSLRRFVDAAQRGDPFLAFTTYSARFAARRSTLVTFTGSTLSLAAMEAREQIHAFGHLTRLADLVGGNLVVGSIVLFAASLSLALGWSCFSRALVATAERLARFVRAWIAIPERRRSEREASLDATPVRATALVIAGTFRMRAPPYRIVSDL